MITPMHRPLIMGVINITPDSFSDGGQFLSPANCLKQIAALENAGADIIEFGAESSRPGSEYIDEGTECQRLSGILELLKGLKISAQFGVDTRKPKVMRLAADSGISFFNNIEGVCEEQTLRYLAAQKANYIAMHMHQTPKTMQKNPLDASTALSEMAKFASAAKTQLLDTGFSSERVFVDPGIGFGKDDAANLSLIGQVSQLAQTANVAIGISRKGLITRLFGADSIAEKDMASKALEASLLMMGAQIIRTHAVERIVAIRDMLFPRRRSDA